ncbi:hypothetical protein EVAR_46064_1 [Eumeta japonica]|uniref:Uncharacterized protein n=1 Tax=Eumeta variegata TaxID=151549 RepID=A0A4C1SP89_EUMVA|nr:hypothetical protein EVAR_46064_1 [Eumeta japonica]
MSSQLSWPMSSSGWRHEAPPGGTSFSHWHNFQQRFDSPVPIFVTVSLTADSFGALPARVARRCPCSDGAAYGGRGYTLRSLSHGSTRGALKASHAASLCSDALRTLCRHFGLRVHFEGFTSPRRARLSSCALALN